MEDIGEPIIGTLHTTDASAGVAVPIYNEGGVVVRTLHADEYIEIVEASLVTVAGGDCRLFFGSSMTPAAGSEIIRGTFAANGGQQTPYGVIHAGKPGETVRLLAPVGVVDVHITGRVRREHTTGRAAWKGTLA